MWLQEARAGVIGMNNGGWGKLPGERPEESNTDHFHQGSDMSGSCYVLRPCNVVTKDTDLGIRHTWEKILTVNLLAV